MLNQIILVGRLYKGVEIEEEKNRKVSTITLVAPRSYKNEEGIYESDFIKIKVYDNMAENIKDYCAKGDILGIKGRIQSEEEENTKMEIIAEKVTFLSSRK